MISGKTFRDFICLLDQKVKANPNGPIEITVSMIDKAGVSMSDAKNILDILASHPKYKVLQVIHYGEMRYTKEGDRELFALVQEIGGFYKLYDEVDAYYSFLLDPRVKKKVYYRWNIYPNSKETVTKAKEWQDIVDTATASSQIDWSSVSANSDANIRRQAPTLSHKARVGLEGNEIILTLDDSRKSVIKKLRTDQAPIHFIKYLLLNPNQLITKTVIQTSVEMCSQKDDLTELVRQCGFDKSLKSYFFSGTTRQKVYFNPESVLSEQIVSQLFN